MEKTFTLKEVEELTKLAFELGQGSILGPDEVVESELYYHFNFEFILENI